MGIGERWQRWWHRLAHGEVKAGHAPAIGSKARPGPTQRRKVGSAGFDPYANDAGYEKPGNWDKVDPR